MVGNAVSYFDFELIPEMAASLVHTLNRACEGARKLDKRSGFGRYLDPLGTGCTECREHLLNALFDLVFARNGVGTAVCNPASSSVAENAKPRT